MENNQSEAPVSIPVQPKTPPPLSPPPQVPQKRNNKIVYVTVIGFIVLLVIAVVFILQLSKSKKNQEGQGYATPTSTPATITPVPSTAGPTSSNPSIVLTLKKGLITAVPGTDFSLTFTGKENPPKNCNDCYATTDVDLITKTKKIQLTFVCGGIAGGCTKQIEQVGYLFELTNNLNENTLGIKVTKK